ncbi:MAG TPA: glycine betaine/L-proline ABC transporter substrate-binding protein ProX [Waterburya sp.]|jgi:glycine betaine/proline transport system substrate-binding protein
MKRPIKKLIVAIAIVLLVGLIACQPIPQTTTSSTNSSQSPVATASAIAMPGQGVRVRPGCSTSTLSRFVGEVVNIGLEKLGYNVEKLKELTPNLLHVALANDDLDILAAHWEKLFSSFYKKSGGDKKVERVGVLVPNGVQGYQIDKNTAAQYQITNLEQLKDPKIAQLFDSDRDGKANLVGCVPGWACELVIEYHINTYGLQNTIEQDKGEYPILMAGTIARYKQGKPVLYYAWTPNWVASVLKEGEDTVWLDVPFTSLPKELGKFTEKDTSTEGKNLGFPIDRVRGLATKKFLAANLAAKRWLEQLEIPVEDINAEEKRVYEGEKRPRDIRRHAEEWVNNHQQQIERWLEEARKAAK